MAEDFLPSIYGQMTDKVKEKLEYYKERIASTGGIPKKMLAGLRHLIDEVADMNQVIGDTSLQDLVTKLTEKVTHRSSDDDVDAIKKAINKTLKYVAEVEDAVEERDLGKFAFLAFE